MASEAVPTDYLPSLIAVGGTLTGALISAILAVIVARITAKSQQRALEAELAHASLEATRNMRRAVYSEYLDCMDRWIALSWDVSQFVRQQIAVAKGADERPDAHAAEAELRARERALSDKWSTAVARLSLVSSADVLVAARDLMNLYSGGMQRAWAIGEADHLGFPSPAAIYNLMRRDIGVLDEERTYRSPLSETPSASPDTGSEPSTEQ